MPRVPDGLSSVWAQYTLRVAPERRNAIAATLKAQGIPTAIYYPKALHQQTAYKHYPVAGNGLPASERAALEVLSLPMHPYLDAATQNFVIERVIEALR